MYKGGLAFLVFFLLSLIPNEMYMQIAGVRFEAYRIFLLTYAVFSLQKIINTDYQKFEKWLFIFCGWSLLSFVVNHGVGGIQSGMIRFLEVACVYFIGRDLVLNNGLSAFRWAVSVVAVSYIFMAPLALVESQDGIRITHVWAANIAGTYAEYFIGENYFRMGVYRASVIFSHPILYSIIGMTLIVLTWYLFAGITRYLFIAGFAVAGYTSMTSAGFAMVGIQLALILLDRLAAYWPEIRRYALHSGLVILVLLQLFVHGGAIRFLMNFVALNPQTANGRYLQWLYAWDDVMANKLFGIGFKQWSRPWWMPESVDSYWLAMAITHGLVGMLIVAFFWISVVRYLFDVYMQTRDRYLYLMFCAVCGIIFAGVTVAFFDRAQTFLYLFMGMMVGYAVRQENLMSKSLQISNQKVALRNSAYAG